MATKKKVGRFGPHTEYKTSVENVDVDYTPERPIYVKKAYEDGETVEKGRDESRPNIGIRNNQLDKPLLFADANTTRVLESMCDHVINDPSVERGPTAAELMSDQLRANYAEHRAGIHKRDPGSSDNADWGSHHA